MRHVKGRRSCVVRSTVLAMALIVGAAPTALAEQGKTTKESYVRRCSGCHNEDGTPGKEPARLKTDEEIAMLKMICKISEEDEKRLKELRRQPDFTDPEWKKRHAADKKNGYKELRDVIKNGKKIVIKAKCKDEDTGKEVEMMIPYPTRMPSTRNLSDDEINAMLDYIGTLEKAKPKDKK